MERRSRCSTLRSTYFKGYDFYYHKTRNSCQTAQIFGPCVILAKIMLQKLWQLGLNWDESMPMDLHQTWLIIYDNTPLINKIKIPRRMLCPDLVTIELHGSSDASQKAFGGVVRIFCARNRSSGPKAS